MGISQFPLPIFIDHYISHLRVAVDFLGPKRATFNIRCHFPNPGVVGIKTFEKTLVMLMNSMMSVSN